MLLDMLINTVFDPPMGQVRLLLGIVGVRHRCLTPAALLCWREQKVASPQLAKCCAA